MPVVSLDDLNRWLILSAPVIPLDVLCRWLRQSSRDWRGTFLSVASRAAELALGTGHQSK
jgi:hypothetical protein